MCNSALLSHDTLCLQMSMLPHSPPAKVACEDEGADSPTAPAQAHAPTPAHAPFSSLVAPLPPRSHGAQAVPQLDPQGLHLLDQMLQLDPSRRIRCRAALAHPWFDEVREQEQARGRATQAAVVQARKERQACMEAAAASARELLLPCGTPGGAGGHLCRAGGHAAGHCRLQGCLSLLPAARERSARPAACLPPSHPICQPAHLYVVSLLMTD